MSLHDYKNSMEIQFQRWPFYALIMAAMRQADTDNLKALKVAFPATWDELQARYHAPGGQLPSDRRADPDTQAIPA